MNPPTDLSGAGLDALEKLVAPEAESLPWEVDECDCTGAKKHLVNIVCDKGAIGSVWPFANYRTNLRHDSCASESDAALIVAAVNALPALIAEVRRLRGMMEARAKGDSAHLPCSNCGAGVEHVGLGCPICERFRQWEFPRPTSAKNGGADGG